MSSETLHDAHVAEQVLAGQQEAFQTLVERYFETVRMVALAKTGNVADAEDVTQEAFVQAYTTLGTLRQRDRFAPWIVRIARNIAVSLIRRRERERRHVLGHSPVSAVYPDPGRRELLEAVVRQVDVLPVPLREVVLLHYFDGLTCREIADRLGLSVNAVVKRLSRGRNRLGDRLLREWGRDGVRDKSSLPIGQVMGAIALVPLPDWSDQLTAGTSATRFLGLGQGLMTKSVLLQVVVAVLALGISSYFVVQQFNEVPTTSSAPASSERDARSERAERHVSAPKTAPPGVAESLLDPDQGPVRIRLDDPAPRVDLGIIAGKVVDHLGDAIQDAQIWVSSRHGANGVTTSDARGQFRVEISAPFSSVESGHQHSSLTLRCSKANIGNSALDDVLLNETNLVITLTLPALLTGYVVDRETGAPVQRFSVRTRYPRGRSLSQNKNHEFTSPEGYFQYDAQSGADIIDVIASGYVRRQITVQVAPGHMAEDLLIELDPGGVIAGIVVDELTGNPVQDAYVHAFVPQTYGGRRIGMGGRTNADGTFVVEDVPTDGRLRIEAAAPGGYAPTVVEDVVVGGAKPLRIKLGHGGILTGRVTYEGKIPTKTPYGYHGLVYVADHALETVGSDGNYRVIGVPEGKNLAYAWVIGENGQQYISTRKFVSIRKGGTSTLDFDFNEVGGSIDVAVRGQRVPGSTALFLCLPEAPDQVLYSEIYDPQELGTPQQFPNFAPGIYLIVAQPVDDAPPLTQEVQIVAGETLEITMDFESQ